jgi:hypothetical protein
MTRRAGASLIELMAVIAATSVLIGLSAGLLRLLMDVERSGDEHLARGMSLGQLGRQFRDDVRAATGVVQREGDEPLKNGITLSLKDGQSVEYQVGEQSVVRFHRSSPRDTQREVFQLPTGVRARLETRPRDDDGREWATLIVSRQSSRTGGEYRVEAVVGGDHRFETKGD